MYIMGYAIGTLSTSTVEHPISGGYPQAMAKHLKTLSLHYNRIACYPYCPGVKYYTGHGRFNRFKIPVIMKTMKSLRMGIISIQQAVIL